MIDNLNLIIENLVLEDFSPAMRNKISEAIQQELQELFKQQNLSAESLQTQQMTHLQKIIPQLDSRASAQTIGREVALAIFNSVTS